MQNLGLRRSERMKYLNPIHPPKKQLPQHMKFLHQQKSQPMYKQRGLAHSWNPIANPVNNPFMQRADMKMQHIITKNGILNNMTIDPNKILPMRYLWAR